MNVSRAAALLLIACSPIFARGRVSGYCQQGGQVVITGATTSSATTPLQRSYPQCQISVFYTNGPGGFVNTSGTSVTLISGTLFNDNSGWPGLKITINGTPYTIQTINSTRSITLTGSAGTQAGVTYAMAATTKAAIFSTNTGTALANPFTSTNTGYWAFYADNGAYDITANGGGIPAPFTWGATQIVEGLNIPTQFSDNLIPSEYSSLSDLCSAAAIEGATVTISGIQPVQTGSCSSSISFLSAGMIRPLSGQIFTVIGSYTCPLGKQCFDPSTPGSIVFSGSGAQQTLDVRMMGAKCDGEPTNSEPAFTGTDDTLAVQSAYSAFPTANSRVQITGPPLQICLLSSVVWKQPVMFAGQGGTLAKYCGVSCSGATAQALIYAGPGNAVGQTFRNITLLGDPAVASDGIHLENDPQTNDGIDTVQINNFGGTGLYLNHANDYTIKDYSASNNGVRNMDIENSTDVNFTGTNVFQSFTVQPTDDVLINASSNIHGCGFQFEFTYGIPAMKFTNSIVDLCGLTAFWTSNSGTLNVPEAFLVNDSASGRIRLTGINTWVQSGTVALPYLVVDTEAVPYAYTANFTGIGNSTATAGFDLLLWGDYSNDGINNAVGAPFALPQSGLYIVPRTMASVAGVTGVAAGSSFDVTCENGGTSSNVSGKGGAGGPCRLTGGIGGDGATPGNGGDVTLQGGAAGSGDGNANGGNVILNGGNQTNSGSQGRIYIGYIPGGIGTSPNISTAPIQTNIGSATGTSCASGLVTSVYAGTAGILFGNACEPQGGYSGSSANAIPICSAELNASNVHVADGKAVGGGGTYSSGDGVTYRAVHCIYMVGWEYF